MAHTKINVYCQIPPPLFQTLKISGPRERGFKHLREHVPYQGGGGSTPGPLPLKKWTKYKKTQRQYALKNLFN